MYDLGVLPFNEKFSSLTLYNFYELDNGSVEFSTSTLNKALESHDYILLPSQRILKSRILHPDKFPHGNTFYTSLLNETQEFHKIYETPCDVWCRLVYWGDPIFSFEQTTNIFDRPTIMIYEKKN